MVNGNMLDKVLDKIRETIGFAKFGDTKILIDTDDKMPDYITIVILITCAMKKNTNFFQQVF